MSTAPVPAPGVPSLAPPPATVLRAWSRSAQLTTAFLLGVAVTLLAIHCFGSGRSGTRPSDLDRDQPFYRIDLNRADRAELLQLPGVGDSLAERLEDYRCRHGGFRSVDELQAVRGVGPATLERLRPWIFVQADDPSAPEVSPEVMGRKSAQPERKSSKVAGLKEPIDVNQATAAELQRLPGIGPKMAQRILDERDKKPFRNVEDLRRVSGIGPKTLERLRPYIVVRTDKLVAAE